MAHRISPDLLSSLHIPPISTLSSLRFCLIHLFPLPFIHLSPTRLVLSSFAPDSHLLSVQTEVEGGCWPLWQCRAVWSFAVRSNQTHCSQTGQHTATTAPSLHPSLCASLSVSALFRLPPRCFFSSLLERTLGSWVTEKETDWLVLGCLFRH